METKSRLIAVYKILEQTDENHPLTTNQIIQELKTKYDLSVNRITLKNDILTLIHHRCDIEEIRKSQNVYFLGKRHFELPQLRLLIDAVEASKLISPSKTKELIEKLYAFASPHQQPQLTRQNYYMDMVKPTNEQVYYIIHTINEAISRQETICFQYYDYNQEKKKYLKHDGRIYALSPYHLVWSGDYYYVVGYSHYHHTIGAFRVDRIAGDPKSCDDPFVLKPSDFDIKNYITSAFQMYQGELMEVTLKCDNTLMKNIIDRFGEDVITYPLDEDTFAVHTEIFVSPTFFGWMFGFQGNIDILSPKTVRQQYVEAIDHAYHKLHQNPSD